MQESINKHANINILYSPYAVKALVLFMAFMEPRRQSMKSHKQASNHHVDLKTIFMYCECLCLSISWLVSSMIKLSNQFVFHDEWWTHFSQFTTPTTQSRFSVISRYINSHDRAMIAYNFTQLIRYNLVLLVPVIKSYWTSGNPLRYHRLGEKPQIDPWIMSNNRMSLTSEFKTVSEVKIRRPCS